VDRNSTNISDTTGTVFFPLLLARAFQNGAAIDILNFLSFAENGLKFDRF